MFSISFLEYILFLLSLSLCFCFKKKSPRKKCDSLNFSLFSFSSSFILSLMCRIFMFTLLAVRLLILHVFSLFSPFFLFPCFLSSCLPLTMFIYSLSLSYASSVYSFQKNHLYLFGFLFVFFSFVHPFLQNCFCSISFVVSHLFSHLFFQSCSFEQEKLTLFFFWQKNSLFNPSKNFSEILSFHVKKNLSSFFRIFEIPLKKSVVCNFVQKSHKMAFATNNISFSDNLFVFRKISVSTAFQEKCFYHLRLVSFIVRKFS